MNNVSSHIKRLLWATAISIALTAIVVAMFKQHRDGLPRPKVPMQINSLVTLPLAAETDCDALKEEYSKLHLYVNGMDTGLKGVGCDVSPPTAKFLLRHVKSNDLSREADQAVWGEILGHPLKTLRNDRELKYDVRWVDESLPATHLSEQQASATLQIFKWWAPVALMVVLYVWFLLGYLGAITTLLRDAAPEGTPLIRRTFSLAKTQMAWWFAIIFASFIFLWLVTGETPSLSAQALGLLGIASATTIASTGVSGGHTSSDGVHGEFFSDLLSDGNGITIHRFQMLVMTMTLGLMFLFSVATTLSMPEFDGSLLTLMGLSAGTYVALKVPELRSDKSNTTVQPPIVEHFSSGDDPKSGYAPTP